MCSKLWWSKVTFEIKKKYSLKNKEKKDLCLIEVVHLTFKKVILEREKKELMLFFFPSQAELSNTQDLEEKLFSSGSNLQFNFKD